MANSPIGITFLPSEENAAQGPKRGNLEGDLGQAFKILSLRLPRVQGAKAIAPPELLNAPGASGLAAPGAPGAPAGGFNPLSTIFETLLKSMAGGGGMSPQSNTSIGLPTAPAPPRIIPGEGARPLMAAPGVTEPVPPIKKLNRGPFTREQ